MSFEQKKKPIQVLVDPEETPQKPKGLTGVPDAGFDFRFRTVELAAAIGMSEVDMYESQILRECVMVGVSAKRFAQAKEEGVCPICFSPSCDWPDSEEAHRLGWKRISRSGGSR